MKKRTEKNSTPALPVLDSGRRATSATVTMAIGSVINLGLFLTKLYVGLSANSLAVLGDAINNLFDSLTCIIAVISFLFVKKKSRESLPYGYGRMEYLADFLMSVVVCIAGGALAYLSIERLTLPYLMTFTWLYFGIVAGTVPVKIFLAWFYRFRNRRIKSGVLSGAMLDSIADVGVTVTTLIGFLLFRYSGLRIDGVFGMIVAVVVVVNGAKLLVSSVKVLLGGPLDEDSRAVLEEILSAFPLIGEVTSAHIHRYGSTYNELVLEVVLTENVTCDILITTIDEIRQTVKSRLGWETKICIVRGKTQ
ncbi:MAG: cation diffusion facilitator family transporter [Clostridia bacterium]|nr:cation diffusion facilitator family transporter [Clostridia bacterium]